jgi:hypothetical protein
MNTTVTENTLTKEALKAMPLNEIAQAIELAWSKVYFGARPYLDAMHTLETMNDRYGMDSAASIVVYFLSNASGFRGPTAKLIRAELKRRYDAR